MQEKNMYFKYSKSAQKSAFIIEYIEKYEAIFNGQEKFFGKCNRNSSYVVLTISSQPYDTLFYISAQNEKKLFETLNSKLK